MSSTFFYYYFFNKACVFQHKMKVLIKLISARLLTGQQMKENGHRMKQSVTHKHILCGSLIFGGNCWNLWVHFSNKMHWKNTLVETRNVNLKVQIAAFPFRNPLKDSSAFGLRSVNFCLVQRCNAIVMKDSLLPLFNLLVPAFSLSLSICKSATNKYPKTINITWLASADIINTFMKGSCWKYLR